MDFDIQPITEAGKRFVGIAEKHVADFASRAEQHDRDGTFPFENVEALRRSGVLAACVPEELGGLGVDSVHDYVAGINRLGRGDGSTAIGVNMHIARPWWLTRAWRATVAAGQARRAETLERFLRRVGNGEVVIAALLSEPGTDLSRPLLEATALANGYVLNGRKIFGTMSPAANIVDVSCRVPDGHGGYLRGIVTIPRDTPGLDVRNNWDALGMRASGSHDVVFTDCFVPADAFLLPPGPWGVLNAPFLSRNAVITMGLVGVFLGIAEAGRDLIVEMLTTRQRGGRAAAERHGIQHAIAEIEIDLAASRAMLDRTALNADRYFATYAEDSEPLAEAHQLMKDFQCTKWFVTRRAVDIIDRAMTASGGAGYLRKNPLSRLYRDVRAGSFMQPFSPNEAFEYVGKVTLGLEGTFEP